MSRNSLCSASLLAAIVLATCIARTTPSVAQDQGQDIRGTFNGQNLPQFFDRVFRNTGKTTTFDIKLDFRTLPPRFKLEQNGCHAQLTDTESKPLRIITFTMQKDKLTQRNELKDYLSVVEPAAEYFRTVSCGGGEKRRPDPAGARSVVINPIG